MKLKTFISDRLKAISVLIFSVIALMFGLHGIGYATVFFEDTAPFI